MKSNANQLNEEKRRTQKELQVLKDKKDLLMRTLELDKSRSDRYQVENDNLRTEVKIYFHDIAMLYNYSYIVS